MLKAKIIINNNYDLKSINYKDSNRTLSLVEVCKKLFTRESDPVRISLDYLIKLRNIATHNFISDYDFDMASHYQENINLFFKNYNKFFPESSYLSNITPFITIIAMSNTSGSNDPLLLNKNTKDIKNFILNDRILEHPVKYEFSIIKKKADADFLVSVDADSKTGVQIIKEPKDINGTYPLTTSSAIDSIFERLKIIANDIHFTSHSFNEIIKKENIKTNTQFCYCVTSGKTKIYKYSKALVNYIVSLLIKDGKKTEYYFNILPMHKKNS